MRRILLRVRPVLSRAGIHSAVILERGLHTGVDDLSTALKTVQKSLHELQQVLNGTGTTRRDASTSGQTSSPVLLRLVLASDGAVNLQASRHSTSEEKGAPVWVTTRNAGWDGDARDAMAKCAALPKSREDREAFAAHVRELLRSGEAVQMAADEGHASAPVALHPPASARKPHVELHRPLTTVIDVTMARTDDLAKAKRLVADLFPRLHLHIEHTSGTDLQSSRTHAFSVALRVNVQGSALSEAEHEALSKFTGESVGLGYHSALRRALQDAFHRVGVTLPEESIAGTSCGGLHGKQSILSLYQSILSQRNARLRVELAPPHVIVRAVQDSEPCVLHTVSGDAKNSLSLVLSAAQAAADKLDNGAARRISAHISASALVMVLPERGVRMKRILRRLLNYYYGTAEEAVDFRVDSPAPGVFTCHVWVPVPFAEARASPSVSTVTSATSAGQSPVSTCCLGSASSTSKRMAMRLAAAQIVREHFAEVFQEQLEYHAEIRELLQISSTTKGSVCPPTSRGLKVILAWAVQQENAGRQQTAVADGATTAAAPVTGADVGARAMESGSTAQTGAVKMSFLTQRLSAGQVHATTQQRASSTVWETVLFIKCTQNGDARACERPLRISAFDFKKTRSEQKAFAAAISQRYKHMCPAAVSHAVQQGLVLPNGEPTPCTGLGTATAATGEVGAAVRLLQSFHVPQACRAAFHSDPILASLGMAPKQTISLSPLPGKSVLAELRERVSRIVAERSGGNTQPANVEEDIQERPDETNDTLHTARLLLVQQPPLSGGAADVCAPRQVAEISRCSHRYKVCALLGAYRQFLLGCQDAPPAAVAAGGGQSQSHSHSSLFDGLPATLPPETPVEAVSVALQKLYGTQLDLHMHTDSRRTTVELWGTLQLPVRQGSARGKGGDEWVDCFLAKGQGSYAAEAVLSCALSAYETHVRPLHSVFAGRRLRRLSFSLLPRKGSLLAQLTSAVTAEITASNAEATYKCHADLRVSHNGNNDPAHAYDLIFSGVMQTKRVELERVTGAGLLLCVCELGACIAKETGQPFVPTALPGAQHAAYERLAHLTKNLLGATPWMEAVHAQGEWHCRVSIPITAALSDGTDMLGKETSHLYYCLATASASKKTDAIEAASVDALASQCPPWAVVGHGCQRDAPSASVSADCSTGAVPSSSSQQNYMFTLV